MSNYTLSVGMEVHAELLTESKMFCRCPVAFGGEPNTRVCPVCLGLPGALPVPNRHAVELVMRTALALNCKIARHSIFHRKNYFYPDLSKAYQISQYEETNPIGYHGWVDIPSVTGSGTKRIGIRRVHLEEDTGKLMHLPGGGSGVDYNRCGVPLMEIVTDFPPDIHHPDEAREYLVQLRQILLYLDVCDGKMEEGSMRCEPNISVAREGADKLGTKTELKNLNRFRSVQLGIDFERNRQIALLESGDTVLQETRGWNESTESSFGMRVKEEANDYRYFPDPDLVPMEFTDAEIEAVRAALPELPFPKSTRYQEQFGLSAYDAGVLTADRDWAKFFEDAVNLGGTPKEIANLITGELAKALNERGETLGIPEPNRAKSRVTSAHISALATLRDNGEISSKIVKDIFEVMVESGEMPADIMERKGLRMVNDDSAIRAMVDQVIAENPAMVEKVRAGQTNVTGFLVGQVMKLSKGQANPQLVQSLMRAALDE